MVVRIPPWAMVTPPMSVLSSSSLRAASWRWRAALLVDGYPSAAATTVTCMWLRPGMQHSKPHATKATLHMRDVASHAALVLSKPSMMQARPGRLQARPGRFRCMWALAHSQSPTHAVTHTHAHSTQAHSRRNAQRAATGTVVLGSGTECSQCHY